MVVLDTRSRDILLLLLQAEETHSIESLATHFQLSPRQVRYALHKSAAWLDSVAVTLRCNKQGEYEFALPDRLRVRLINSLAGEQGFSLALDAEERMQYELLCLLTSDGPIVLKDLGAELGVSSATVSRDLKDLTWVLQDQGLGLTRCARAGASVHGTEQAYRLALVDLLSSIIDPQDLLSILRSKGFHTPPTGGSLLVRTAWRYIQTLDLKFTASQLCNALREQQLADVDIVRIYLYLAVTIRRVVSGHSLTFQEKEMQWKLQDRPAFETASRCWTAISEAHHIFVTPEEVALLTVLLGSARTAYSALQHENAAAIVEGEETQVQEIVRVITDVSSQRLHPFFQIDPLLSRGLVLHLRSILWRLQFGLPISNPLADEIRLSYPAIFQVAEECREAVETIIGKAVPEAEVAFWAMHLGAGLERLRARPRRRVVVVCNEGIATAWLLVSRLRASFPALDVVDVMSIYELCERGVDTATLDAIISTVPLSSVRAHVVVVSPLLGPRDKQTVSVALGIQSDGAHLRQTAKDGGMPDLADLLPKAATKLLATATDWLDATREAGALLVAQGAAETRYVDAIIGHLQRHGPYMVIAPGVALLHALPQEGALRLGMSLLTLRSPCPFGHPTNDPVDIVFAIASIDPRMQLQAFSQLAKLLDDRDSTNVLRNTGEPSRVQHLLSQLRERS